MPLGVPRPETKANELLDRGFRAKTRHSLSETLPVNPDEQTTAVDGENYWEILNPYQEMSKEVDLYDETHPKEVKTDFAEDDENIGWKFHLNVARSHVRAVSRYLKDHGYLHKYLRGGDPENGKIFTVYIGSYAAAQRWSEELARDLRDDLARPSPWNNEEIEFAPGVVGRFSGKRDMFDEHGTCGFTLFRNDMSLIRNMQFRMAEKDGVDIKGLMERYLALLRAKNFDAAARLEMGDKTKSIELYNAAKKRAELQAFQALQEKYGEYFFPTGSVARAEY